MERNLSHREKKSIPQGKSLLSRGRITLHKGALRNKNPEPIEEVVGGGSYSGNMRENREKTEPAARER